MPSFALWRLLSRIGLGMMLCHPLLSLCAVRALAPAHLRARFTCPTRTSHCLTAPAMLCHACDARGTVAQTTTGSLSHCASSPHRRHMFRSARPHAKMPSRDLQRSTAAASHACGSRYSKRLRRRSARSSSSAPSLTRAGAFSSILRGMHDIKDNTTHQQHAAHPPRRRSTESFVH